jgi:hypothetical protein
MINSRISFICLVLFFISACSDSKLQKLSVKSPSKYNKIIFNLSEKGDLSYQVYHKKKLVIAQSVLSFDLLEGGPLNDSLEVLKSVTTEIEENWEMPWGEQKTVKNHCNELTIQLIEQKKSSRKIDLIFRAYDDGVAFRYYFPEQTKINSFHILEEHSEFNLTGDHKTWWTPGDWDIYEHLYNTSKVSEIDALSKRDNPILAQTYIPENAVNTPVTMKTEKGIYLSFHEANLTDYSGMTLKVDNDNLSLTSNLVGGRANYKVKRKLPFSTPWRTIQIADQAGDLIESKLIVNLNEPSKIEDISWFKPTKYVGIWWEMHLGKSSWSTGPNHGSTTERAKKHIDFAEKNNIGSVLFEGWNTGWEKTINSPEDRENQFDFVTPYFDYDLEEVADYAKQKGVDLIMHHETNAAPRTYEKQLDTAYSLMKRLDIHTVKTGYVGPIVPEGEYHHGQWMVNHYRKVLETAAKYQVAINAHEPIKPTGIRRTWPNAISREGLRGQEFNAYSQKGGDPPEHLPIVAFTRMLAGPIDFTPGIFNIKMNPYKPANQVKTTLAKQLALYVVIYSPIQMAADLIEHYENQPAFQFIRDVAVDWEESRVLNGEVGEFVTIARKERNGDNWFLGSISNQEGRFLKINADFLDADKAYLANIYRDGPNAHWDTNPLDIIIEQFIVNKETQFKINLAPGGGFAISFMPAIEEMKNLFPPYP